ncbi:MAG: HalOD1 output domain-containing protein [Halobacteriota archaeon]
MSDGNSFLLDILQALADADRVAIDDLEYTLHEYFDPEIIEQLGTQTDTEWELRFEVESHSVTMKSDGQLFVDGVACGTGAKVVRQAGSPETMD